MNVISLFNGMGCGEIALIEEGIYYNKMYTSEVDKHALNQTRFMFPNNIELGDVRNIDVSKLDPIDLLIGGSPCQSFSFAGKRKGMSTKCEIEITRLEQYLDLKEQGFEFEGQSYLFWEYMRILTDIRKHNPDVLFLLENVEMGVKWERILSEAIGIYGVHINSALVSAQNRKRIYWTNIRVKKVGLFGELHSDIPQPKDRGILLKDILESEVDEKYYLSDTVYNRLVSIGKNETDLNSKSKCLTGAGGHGQGNNSDMNFFCVSMVGRKTDENGTRKDYDPNIKAVQRLEPNINGKTNCLTSVQKDNLVMCLTPKRTEYGKQIRKEYEAGKVAAMRKEVSQLEPREDGKTNTITTVQKDNLVMQINPSTESGGKQPYQQNRVYDSEGISPALCANKADLLIKQNYAVIGDGYEQDNRAYFEDGKSGTLDLKSENRQKVLLNNTRIRRLTPTECARLQTIPDWYKWNCSSTQQYRQLGNGWTVDVIRHIFSFIDKDLIESLKEKYQYQLIEK